MENLMARSFGLVDDKIAEADFFLEKLAESGFDLFASRCFFNAFVAAARSVTFSLQAVLCDVSGFSDWYEHRQAELRDNELARFFVEARNTTQKVGEHPVTGGSMRTADDGSPLVTLRFSSSSKAYPRVPSQDVITACETYLAMLVGIVLSCYEEFGRVIDPEQYYAAEAFGERGLTIDDADEEVMGVRGWTEAPGVPLEARWQLIRDSVSRCEIDYLFDKYTGRSRPRPERPLAKPPLKQGWHIPEGLRETGDDEEDIRRFIASLKKRKDA
jgi:hypothetical protein